MGQPPSAVIIPSSFTALCVSLRFAKKANDPPDLCGPGDLRFYRLCGVSSPGRVPETGPGAGAAETPCCGRARAGERTMVPPAFHDAPRDGQAQAAASAERASLPTRRRTAGRPVRGNAGAVVRTAPGLGPLRSTSKNSTVPQAVVAQGVGQEIVQHPVNWSGPVAEQGPLRDADLHVKPARSISRLFSPDTPAGIRTVPSAPWRTKAGVPTLLYRGRRPPAPSRLARARVAGRIRHGLRRRRASQMASTYRRCR
jgi:hypothetical protein